MKNGNKSLRKSKNKSKSTTNQLKREINNCNKCIWKSRLRDIKKRLF
jgi:hypothetical protein